MISPWFISSLADSNEARLSWWIDYPAYYQRLAMLMSQTTDGDEMFMLDWLFDEAAPFGGKTFLDYASAAVGRGCKLRMLLSGTAQKGNSPATHAATINGLKGKYKPDARVDGQSNSYLPNGPYQSFHQKAVYLRVGKVGHLFVGGMDVATGRTGGGAHWLDAMAEVTGHAAELGRQTLEMRWASVTGAIAPGYAPINVPADSLVQFPRTFPKPHSTATNAGRTYLPNGEFTIQEALVHACTQAKEFIYIEDQYFVGDQVNGTMTRTGRSVDDELVAAAARGVQIIGVCPHANYGNEYGPRVRRRALTQRIVGPLADKSRFVLFTLKAAYVAGRQPYNFVHTKTWIFDDEFAIVGSANYTQMSMTFEAEFGVSVADGANKKVVPDLRRGLWLRLLNATPAGGPAATPFAAKDVVDWKTGLASLRVAHSPLEIWNDPAQDPYPPRDDDGS